jgi:hypothetical protein
VGWVGTTTRIAEPLALWWRGTSPLVKVVYLALLANGVPAFILLMCAPAHTDDLFVWTIQPPASARLLGVMYGNALLLVALGVYQPCWARARVIFVLVSVFSVAATIVTFVNIDPFLEHPWFHLTYWLTMYAVLFVAAPAALWSKERAHGGRLAVEAPLTPSARAGAALAGTLLGGLGVVALASPATLADIWPWELSALVARIVGVWLTALGVAFAWVVWDGDRVRTRPMFMQGIPTGTLLALLPLVHGDDLKAGAAAELAAYLALAGLLIGIGVLDAGRRRAPTARGRA